LLIGALGVSVFWYKAMRLKENNSREIDFLMDCHFYRQVIEKYKLVAQDSQDGTMIGRIRKEVQSELDYKTSKFSEPARIKSRLEELRRKDERIDKFIDKIYP